MLPNSLRGPSVQGRFSRCAGRSASVFGRFSGWVRVEATQLAQAAHIVGEVLHPDRGLGPHQADRAHQGAAHVVGLHAKDMLDPDPHGGFGAATALGLFSQRLAALAFTVDVAFQLAVAQLALRIRWTLIRLIPIASAIL